MPTILQLSDAHLSPRNGLFRANLERVRQAVAADPPDLVVATGDLSLDGADREPDMELAAALHRAFPAPLLALPGNHDIGSEPRLQPKQPVDDARLDRWRRHLGPGRGVVDLPGWRVVGLNSEVMGTGHPEEAAQAAFIAEAAADAGERRIALFLHKPPFLAAADEPWNPWSVPPEARAALAPLLGHPGLRLVASGHLHLHHQVRRGQVEHVWAPALSFYVKPADQAGIPGGREPGALLHRLHADHVETVRLAPAGMEAVLIDTVQDQTYPR
ncbi:metallophosphoesterase family protein [Falsiroseomonas oryzae]|uniref:metallophosphoesterase family protein n=1 Tax=Falsiroseomonas oryzae TaxID=2766473 RepID=UPI0022EAF9B9|nr:metallophosphoesterase [Roseomonas sp. MO-31]